MAKNLVLSEAEFDEFRQYCHEKEFDLSYFGPNISGSKEEIERYQFDGRKLSLMIVLNRHLSKF